MSDIVADPIQTNIPHREDFRTATGGAKTPMEQLDEKGLPMLKQTFGKAVDGIGRFAENNPNLTMWASFGLALLATPAVLSAVRHLPTTGKNLGKLALKIGAALAVANVAATWAANPEGGFTGALAKTGADFGALVGLGEEDGSQAPVIRKDGESPPVDGTLEQSAAMNKPSYDMSLVP